MCMLANLPITPRHKASLLANQWHAHPICQVGLEYVA